MHAHEKKSLCVDNLNTGIHTRIDTEYTYTEYLPEVDDAEYVLAAQICRSCAHVLPAHTSAAYENRN